MSTTLLVVGSAILGVNPISEPSGGWRVGDLFVPAAAATGAQTVVVDSLPTDFAPRRYTWDGSQLQPVAQDLSAIKALKNDEINAARLAANRSSFTYTGKAIACDELSRSDIDGVNGFVALTGALPLGWPGGWKAMDNSIVVIADVADWTAFYGAMVAAGNANFAHAQTLKTQLAAASTEAAVAAIRW